MDIVKVRQLILIRLKTELSPELTYHSYEHTLDVLNASIFIADQEKINKYEKTLLITAVLFHDIGFIYQTHNHEEKSCEIAKETLAKYNYTSSEIDIICNMIMATKIPQVANNKLEKIICDADLDYLGRDDFDAISHNLYQELLSLKLISDLNEWNLKQIDFLNNHKYFTQYSISNRNPKKLKNIETIKLKLN